MVPTLALIAAVALAWGWGLSITDIALAVGFYLLGALGITAGFHRLFTHRAFKANRALPALVRAICWSRSASPPSTPGIGSATSPPPSSSRPSTAVWPTTASAA